MKRVGRPPGRTLAGAVSVRLPLALYDEIATEAVRRRITLAAVVRERLRIPKKTEPLGRAAQ